VIERMLRIVSFFIVLVFQTAHGPPRPFRTYYLIIRKFHGESTYCISSLNQGDCTTNDVKSQPKFDTPRTDWWNSLELSFNQLFLGGLLRTEDGAC
jgi:hypothetical protein